MHKASQSLAIASSSASIRESMAALPSWMQPFLTWLTATPLRGQKPTCHTALYHLSTCLAKLSLGLVSAWVAFATNSLPTKWAGILLGWALVLSAVRKLQIVIVHHCAHHNFFGRTNPANAYLGRVLSFLLFIEPYDSYRIAHTRDHHFSKHMTAEDPTVEFLFNRLKLRPGMPVAEAKRRMISRFVSPMFYLDAFVQRIKQQKESSVAYRVVLFSFWTSVVVLASVSGNLGYFFVAWVVPLTLLYPISSALRLVVEHTFPVEQTGRKFDLMSLSVLTNAVFCGERFPEKTDSIWKNAALSGSWAARILFIHLPVRALVLVGDTPVHDHHHRHPLYKDWPNYAFARFSEAPQPKAGFAEYREVWGYGAALDHSLASLSAATE